MYCFCFFKQKTAYEMRISDWSSDVCSSDLSGHTADKNPPVLHHRDRFGRDVQHIEYHPAYRQMEKLAYHEIGIHAMSYRPGVLGWDAPLPAAVKYAATYLFNQAEFGLGCPINVSETVSYLLMRHGDQALRSEEHTSELQSLMRISYAVFCLK